MSMLSRFGSKYYRNNQLQSDLYSGSFIGRGPGGWPVRGSSHVQLASSDAEYQQMPLVNDFGCRMFNLWNEDDLAWYRKVKEHAWNGMIFIKKEVEMAVADARTIDAEAPAGPSLRVWVEWTLPVYEPRQTLDPVQTQVSRGFVPDGGN